jgi:hypothetical protein
MWSQQPGGARLKGLEPFDPDVIVARARNFLRDDLIVGYYHLLTQNCEHFATMCRYGEGFSLQAAGGQYILWKLGQLYSRAMKGEVDQLHKKKSIRQRQ